ncbi:hypothetical protein Glove_46g68 [Diversispora epigaea]|uniref:Uncharacterized protein n=1 Tax=Diversispora epigaea TaxID=1348612 RepID=A0A397JPE6_9GLOM|nr:hypothetical protein Glove_46g68 [Diversispora epigaea]
MNDAVTRRILSKLDILKTLLEKVKKNQEDMKEEIKRKSPYFHMIKLKSLRSHDKIKSDFSNGHENKEGCEVEVEEGCKAKAEEGREAEVEEKHEAEAEEGHKEEACEYEEITEESSENISNIVSSVNEILLDNKDFSHINEFQII